MPSYLYMVDLSGKTSNSLFEILEMWESYIKAENIDIPKLLKETKFHNNKSTKNLLNSL